MRFFLALAVVFTLSPIIALAQGTETPAWEMSVGYQYLRADTNVVQKLADSVTNSFTPPLPRINAGSSLSMNGGDFGIEENVNDWLGGTFDFGGAYGNRHIDLSEAVGLPSGSAVAIFRPTIYTFTGGPQFHYRKGQNFQPFARILLGGAHASLSPDDATQAVLTALVPTFRTDRNSFAGIVGGGVDYVWKDSIAFRVTGDYVRTYLFDEHQSNLRVTVGVDFRFGSK